ncbi:hypothetical protein T440DRAFT_467213 [Plenodomus tracheiphilus IPT5]|uniref:Uncharacterized protein n=1 Tax=Plenodomus tracheiphilus IPT5 TaxID=1408161 RepID=A0A6A7BC22_9PLEO|nr:hypothetical protein T440DRAFT_467213 [Plenodomus tracheiphilus IPT5]
MLVVLLAIIVSVRHVDASVVAEITVYAIMLAGALILLEFNVKEKLVELLVL